jgi:hypothetical protein
MWSHPGDLGGEEVHGVPVEVAAGAVVVLGGARVGVPGEDLGVAQRADVAGMPAVFAIRTTMR